MNLWEDDMAVLLLKFIAPMQSWGVKSRFTIRDTEKEPTKSGVIGLLAAALGRRRHEPIEDLARLRVGVRVDREGTIFKDYQTVQGVLKASVSKEQWLKGRQKNRIGGRKDVVSTRYYLSDAAFLVGLEGKRHVLEGVHEALLNPCFQLYLGRKGYLPGEPITFKQEPIVEGSLEDVLPPQQSIVQKDALSNPRYALEVSYSFNPGGVGYVREIWDQPSGTFSERKFSRRYVWSFTLPRGEAIHVSQ